MEVMFKLQKNLKDLQLDNGPNKDIHWWGLSETILMIAREEKKPSNEEE